MSGDGVFLITDSALVEMQAEAYANEDDLQSLLAHHPAVMAGAKIDPVSPRRWILVAREYGVPSRTDGGNQLLERATARLRGMKGAGWHS